MEGIPSWVRQSQQVPAGLCASPRDINAFMAALSGPPPSAGLGCPSRGRKRRQRPQEIEPWPPVVSRRFQRREAAQPGHGLCRRPPGPWALLPSLGHRLLKAAGQKGRHEGERGPAREGTPTSSQQRAHGRSTGNRAVSLRPRMKLERIWAGRDLGSNTRAQQAAGSS